MVALPSGGTITYDGNYIIHTFTSNGTFINDLNLTSVSYLILAGAGGGGAQDGGGGGAGGLNFTTWSGTFSPYNYSVVIGEGGLGGDGAGSTAGAKGGNSSFNNQTTNGGGGGASNTQPCSNGGSGGAPWTGGTGTTVVCNGTSTQGYRAGDGDGGADPWTTGGGGGAGSQGYNATATQSGKGGYGYNTTIRGSLECFGSGGGGGVRGASGTPGNTTCGGGNGSYNAHGGNATPNSGSGGGGGGYSTNNGGKGGSGIVIIRYLNPTASINIFFYSQNPSNVTDLTLFTQDINLTYNYSNTNFSGSASLNLTVYHSETSCYQFSNGTCIKANNSYSTIQPSSNATNTNYTLISYTLRENDIYPYTENLNYTFFNQTHSTYNLTTGNSLISFTLKNISTDEQFYILEIMTLSSNNLSRLYACNNTYNFASQITSSQYCSELSIIKNNYNHTHNSFNSHQLFAFVINNGKINGGSVSPSNTMHFIIMGANTGTHNVSYINNYSFIGATRTSNNGGNTFTNQTFSVNTHLHSYNNSEYYATSAIGNYSGSLNHTSFTTEKIDLSNLPPNPPVITTPFETTQSTRYLNITYTNATSNIPGITISYYNITLLNSDLTFNQTIQGNNSRNNSFYWDVYNQNLTLGLWYVKVEAFDSTSLSNFDFESFNLTKNAILNLSAKKITNNVTINFFYVNATDNLTGEFIEGNTSNGTLQLDVIINRTYELKIRAENYTTSNKTITINSSFVSDTFYLYAFNSLLISFYDETTLLAMNNVTVYLDLISLLFSANYSTPNGTLEVELLEPETYQARYYSSGYTERFYSFTVTNNSAQTLSLYLKPNSTSILVQVKDVALNPVEGYIVKAQKLVPSINQHITVEIGTTDFNGEILMSLSQNDEYYRFIVLDADGNVLLTTDDAYIIDTTIILNLPGLGATGEEAFQYLNIDASIDYDSTTNIFTFDFSDPSNLQSQFCLTVYKDNILNGQNCTTSDLGSLYVTITPVNGSIFRATGTILLEDALLLAQDVQVFSSRDTNTGNLGLLMQIMLSLLFIIFTLKLPEMIPLAFGISLLLGRAANLNILDWTTVSGITFGCLILSVWLGKKRDS